MEDLPFWKNVDSSLVPPQPESTQEDKMELDSTMLLMMLFQDVTEIKEMLEEKEDSKEITSYDPNLFGTTSNQLE